MFIKRKRKRTRKPKERKKRKLSPEYDYEVLSEKYPNFGKFVKNGKVDYNDPLALIELTKTILLDQLNVEWNLPVKFLCPPVPRSLNYVNWIEDLLEVGGVEGKITGLDVGVGASCIFPLIGKAKNDWSFLSSDINPEAIESAEKNVRVNKFDDFISVILNRDSTKIFHPFFEGEEQNNVPYVHFTMCNPPFFSNEKEAFRNNPHRTCNAVKEELMYVGGEVAFIKKMVDESILFKDKIFWFTSMMGKKSTLKTIKEYLKQKCIFNVFDKVLSQGFTSRWCVAWTFHPTVIFLSKPNASFYLNGYVGSVLEKVKGALRKKWPDGYRRSGHSDFKIKKCNEVVEVTLMSMSSGQMLVHMKSNLPLVTFHFQEIYDYLSKM